MNKNMVLFVLKKKMFVCLKGPDLSPLDLLHAQTFAQGVIDLTDYRKKLYDYLVVKVKDVAPNLAALIGETVAARLISHAGSLRNLAKHPSSTLQILGAERALRRCIFKDHMSYCFLLFYCSFFLINYVVNKIYRALRTGGKTPKHGLIVHSSFIGRASARNKGRMARCLAAKCSIAARVDYFGGNDCLKCPFVRF